MAQTYFTPPKPRPAQISAELQPVRTILLCLWAMTAEDAPPVDPWISKAAAQLSPEQRHFNRLLFTVFGGAILPEVEYHNFAAYLDDGANQPVATFAQKIQTALADGVETEFASEAEQLASDPPKLRLWILAHFRKVWEEILEAEWKRYEPRLLSMTRSLNETVFNQPRWQQTSAVAALRFMLQSEPSDPQLAQLGDVQRVVLVLSPFIQGYCNRFGSSDTLWVYRQFDPQWMRRDALRRVEVLSPLNGLADESRLRILELLTEQGELRAQELIPQLESSQGNVSRHLKQLLGGGYVSERRGDGANKVYAYDEKGLQRLIFLLRQLLSNQNAQSTAQEKQLEAQLEQVRSAVSPTLQKFLDEQGRITRWSSKLNDQQAMMEYLIEKFEREKGYSEKEVNELLQTWYLDADFVLIRRGMVDAGIIKRTKDGARYWRE